MKIFYSDTTADTICAAIFLIKKDNRREKEEFFTDSLTEKLSEQQKKMKTVLIKEAELLITDSEQSDEKAVETNRQKKLEKTMILDKCEKSDLIHLIMRYVCESERTEAQLSLNSLYTDLQNHLNTQLKEDEVFAQHIYTELLKRRRTYNIVNKITAQIKIHILNINEMCYDDWFESQQLQWTKDYCKCNIQWVIQRRESEFIQSLSVTLIMFSLMMIKTGLKISDRTLYLQ